MPPKKIDAKGQISDSDLNHFFEVLRFVSSVKPLDTASSSQPPSAIPENRKTGVATSRANRVRLPESVEEALDLYRMAATNLPIDEAAVKDTREALHRALVSCYGEDQRAAIDALFEDKPSEPIPVSKGVPNMQSMQEIIPGLYCGSYHPATDKELLMSKGITHILCCIGTAPRFPGSFMYLTISADDRADFDLTPFFARTFEFIENALVKEHKNVLVHCGAGISRSAAIVAAYLIRKLRLPAVEAVEMVRRRRPFACPNAGFIKQLKEYARQLEIDRLEGSTEMAEKERFGREEALKACLANPKDETEV